MVRSASSLSFFSRLGLSAQSCASAALVGALLVAGPVAPARAASDADAAGKGQPEAGVPARPISEKPPSYPPAAKEAGREGWVQVSYVIEADGSVNEVFIEDSVGGADFKQAVSAAVMQWRYEPATLAGKSTVQSVSWLFIPFSSTIKGKGEQGSSALFKRRYRTVMSQRKEGDLEEAAKLTHGLAQSRTGLNLYEASSIEVLESLVSRDQGDDRAELQHLQRAAVDSGAYLEGDAYKAILLRTFALQVELGRYADALATYDSLESIMGEGDVPDTVTKVASQVRALGGVDEIYSVPGVLGEAEAQYGGQGAYSQHLLRRLVGFTSESFDDLNEYDLRCEFRRVKGTPKPERAVRIPEEWGDCRIYVYGVPGTEFQFVQYVAPSS